MDKTGDGQRRENMVAFSLFLKLSIWIKSEQLLELLEGLNTNLNLFKKKKLKQVNMHMNVLDSSLFFLNISGVYLKKQFRIF